MTLDQLADQPGPLPSRARRLARVSVVVTAVACLASGALIVAAVLAHAPVVVLPLIVVVAVGGPLLLGGDLRAAIAVLRHPAHRPLRRRHIARLGGQGAPLGEVDHPLGL
jgi:hypothetical protein